MLSNRRFIIYSMDNTFYAITPSKLFILPATDNWYSSILLLWSLNCSDTCRVASIWWLMISLVFWRITWLFFVVSRSSYFWGSNFFWRASTEVLICYLADSLIYLNWELICYPIALTDVLFLAISFSIWLFCFCNFLLSFLMVIL